MRLIIREQKKDKDETTVEYWAANYVAKRIRDFKPTAERPFVLGLPTGSTPIKMYKALAAIHNNKETPPGHPDHLSFEHVVTFNMDEYVFPKDQQPCAKNPNSYHHFMWNNLFQHIDIKPENVHVLNGDAEDLSKEAADYEAAIKSYGKVELFIGGIGADGHVAFNEPGSSLVSRTRVKTLALETIIHNEEHFAKYKWDEEATFDKNWAGKDEKYLAKGAFVPDDAAKKPSVPHEALTVGVGTFMDANEVMVLVTGQKKALALAKCIEEGVSHQWTVSKVQEHPRAVIVCDREATHEMRVRTVNYFEGLEAMHNQTMLGKEMAEDLEKDLSALKALARANEKAKKEPIAHSLRQENNRLKTQMEKLENENKTLKAVNDDWSPLLVSAFVSASVAAVIGMGMFSGKTSR